VVGTASWRRELDSLDWRLKPTLRLIVTGPESTLIVIRLVSAAIPRGGFGSSASRRRTSIPVT
jgi:hypothetical protein